MFSWAAKTLELYLPPIALFIVALNPIYIVDYITDTLYLRVQLDALLDNKLVKYNINMFSIKYSTAISNDV